MYLDDIIIFATSAQEMMLRMDEVISRLSQAGLKLKADKCYLFQEQVRFLGHAVSKNGIGPDPEKVQAIHEWPSPRNVTDVRAFVGLCSYYRRYIRGFNKKARPLFKLQEAGEVFQLTSECESAFQNIKGVLSGNEVLAYPRNEGLYILDTDASNVGIGATMSQMQWYDMTQEVRRTPDCICGQNPNQVPAPLLHHQAGTDGSSDLHAAVSTLLAWPQVPCQD